ncbi:MAG: ABC transporter substrate-binding protein [Hyphomonadaceae bacterium]
MTAPSLTRAALLAGLAGFGLLAAAPEAHAARNPEAERYVQQNAAATLNALGGGTMNMGQRQQTFERLMTQFADIQRIAIFVVGRYGAALRADPALRRDWIAAFQDYAIATYEDQFEGFSGAAITVTGSVERVAGSDVVVTSTIRPPGQTQQTVQWRVIRSGEVWKVVDVAAGRDQVWLAQFQQRQFLSALNDNQGDIRALISDVRQQTSLMRQRILARS